MNKSEPITEIPYKMWGGRKCISHVEANALLDDSAKFKMGDPHPSIKGLVYRYFRKEENKHKWVTQEAYELNLKNNIEHHKKWREAHPERVKKSRRNYKKTYAARVAADNAYRRAQKRGADISFEGVDQYTEHDKKMTEVMYDHAQRLTKILGSPFHVDHIQPLSCGGSNKPYNLQVVPAKHNLEKNNNSFAIWGAPFGRSDMHIFDAEIFNN